MWSVNAALWKHSELNLPMRSDLTVLDDNEAKSLYCTRMAVNTVVAHPLAAIEPPTMFS